MSARSLSVFKTWLNSRGVYALCAILLIGIAHGVLGDLAVIRKMRDFNSNQREIAARTEQLLTAGFSTMRDAIAALDQSRNSTVANAAKIQQSAQKIEQTTSALSEERRQLQDLQNFARQRSYEPFTGPQMKAWVKDAERALGKSLPIPQTGLAPAPAAPAATP